MLESSTETSAGWWDENRQGCGSGQIYKEICQRRRQTRGQLETWKRKRSQDLRCPGTKEPYQILREWKAVQYSQPKDTINKLRNQRVTRPAKERPYQAYPSITWHVMILSLTFFFFDNKCFLAQASTSLNKYSTKFRARGLYS